MEKTLNGYTLNLIQMLICFLMIKIIGYFWFKKIQTESKTVILLLFLKDCITSSLI